jgi:histidinol-phosphatase
VVVRADLELAIKLGRLAAAMGLCLADGGAKNWSKPDGTAVTEADLAIEAAMVKVLACERPADGVLSEETARWHGTSGRQWVLDPIDGTSSFLAGGRNWGTHVALSEASKVTAAVVTRPTEGRCWWAALGSGAYASSLADPVQTAERLRVSDTGELSRARLGGLVPSDLRAEAALCDRVTWAEDDVSIIAALLEGRVDAVIDIGGDPWDIAPATLLVTEAGGRVQDPVGGTRFDLRWCLFTNAQLQDELSALLAETSLGVRKESPWLPL